MKDTLRGADIITESLTRAGVEQLFSLSGNHVMSIYDATLDSGLKILHVRHEAAAVHMADAWARLTGQVGVVVLTGGPGHANGVSALYTALMSESPVVLLSGHAPRAKLGAGAFQEMRQADIAEPLTKAAWTAEDATTLGQDVARAIRIARSGRPGPVHLSLPEDVLDAVVTADSANLPSADAFRPTPQSLPDGSAREIVENLTAAERPLILTGPFAHTQAAGDMVQRLEQATGVPVVTMASPRGVNDPSLGAFAEVLSKADCVLLLGKQPDFTLQYLAPPALHESCRLFQVDPDQVAHTRLTAAASAYDWQPRQFHADPLSAAEALIAAADERHSAADWRVDVEHAIDYRPAEWKEATGLRSDSLHPAQLFAVVQPLLDTHPDAVFVCDGGEIGQWAQACLGARHRVMNGPAGAIGVGLPFAMAARLAYPEAPVIAVMGDGSIGFHLAEFDTALRHDLPFLAVVGNDACWNAEYQIQLRKYGPERAVGCELLSTRYDQVANALGGHGEWVDHPDALSGALERAMDSGKPACVNVSMDRTPAPLVRRQ